MAFNPGRIEALSELLKPPGDDDSSSDVRKKILPCILNEPGKTWWLDLLIFGYAQDEKYSAKKSTAANPGSIGPPNKTEKQGEWDHYLCIRFSELNTTVWLWYPVMERIIWLSPFINHILGEKSTEPETSQRHSHSVDGVV